MADPKSLPQVTDQRPDELKVAMEAVKEAMDKLNGYMWVLLVVDPFVGGCHFGTNASDMTDVYQLCNNIAKRHVH